MTTYLTTAEAAKYCRVSAKYLKKLRCVGGGPIYVKNSLKVFYDQDDLDVWMNSLKVRSTAEATLRDRVEA